MSDKKPEVYKYEDKDIPKLAKALKEAPEINDKLSWIDYRERMGSLTHKQKETLIALLKS